MKKQRRGLNRYDMQQDGKKEEKVSIHINDTLKTNCEEKKLKKKRKERQQQKKVLMGFEPTSTKINGSYIF